MATLKHDFVRKTFK